MITSVSNAKIKNVMQLNQKAKARREQGLFVAAGDKVLEITELQAPGKKRMKARDYLNGHAIALPAAFEE